jgi:predicted metal-binding membrane protein
MKTHLLQGIGLFLISLVAIFVVILKRETAGAFTHRALLAILVQAGLYSLVPVAAFMAYRLFFSRP